MTDAAVSIDAYLADLAPQQQEAATRVRQVLRDAAPAAVEAFRYRMPAVTFADGYSLQYAAWKKHLGLYPVGELPEPLAGEVAPLRTKVDTVALPYSDGVPDELVGRIAAALAERHG